MGRRPTKTFYRPGGSLQRLGCFLIGQPRPILSLVNLKQNPCPGTFHGPKGANISTETGLLKKWPEQGPRLLWTTRGIGQGFVGVTIANGRIYTAGDVGGDNVIFALDMDGRIRWQVKNGAAFSLHWRGMLD